MRMQLQVSPVREPTTAELAPVAKNQSIVQKLFNDKVQIPLEVLDRNSKYTLSKLNINERNHA